MTTCDHMCDCYGHDHANNHNYAEESDVVVRVFDIIDNKLVERPTTDEPKAEESRPKAKE